MIDLVLKHEPFVNEHDKYFLEHRRILIYLRGVHKMYRNDVWSYFIISFFYIGKNKYNQDFWSVSHQSFLNYPLIVYFVGFMWDIFHLGKGFEHAASLALY